MKPDSAILIQSSKDSGGDGKKPTLQMINVPSFATLPQKYDAKAAAQNPFSPKQMMEPQSSAMRSGYGSPLV